MAKATKGSPSYKIYSKVHKNSIYNQALRKASLNLVRLNNIRRNKLEFLTTFLEAFTINLSKSDEDISKKKARLFLERAYARSPDILCYVGTSSFQTLPK